MNQGLHIKSYLSHFHTKRKVQGGWAGNGCREYLGGETQGNRQVALPTTLTLSLCRGSSVNHRAMAQRCPLVTAFTPCGFSVPEENPTALPHWGCTSAYGGGEGKWGKTSEEEWIIRTRTQRTVRGELSYPKAPGPGTGDRLGVGGVGWGWGEAQ